MAASFICKLGNTFPIKPPTKSKALEAFLDGIWLMSGADAMTPARLARLGRAVSFRHEYVRTSPPPCVVQCVLVSLFDRPTRDWIDQ